MAFNLRRRRPGCSAGPRTCAGTLGMARLRRLSLPHRSTEKNYFYSVDQAAAIRLIPGRTINNKVYFRYGHKKNCARSLGISVIISRSIWNCDNYYLLQLVPAFVFRVLKHVLQSHAHNLRASDERMLSKPLKYMDSDNKRYQKPNDAPSVLPGLFPVHRASGGAKYARSPACLPMFKSEFPEQGRGLVWHRLVAGFSNNTNTGGLACTRSF